MAAQHRNPEALAAELANQLNQGLAALGLTHSVAQQAQLVDYVLLLYKWNKAYNLTAVRDPVAMIQRHVLDSLSLGEQLHGERVLDIGSGGGLPGVPLAITQPQRQFTLLDSNGKKTRFLQQVVLELQLANVTVEQSRAEAYTPAAKFDTVTARAVAEPEVLFGLAANNIAVGGRLLVMVGPNQVWPEQALSQAWHWSRLALPNANEPAYRGVCLAERLS